MSKDTFYKGDDIKLPYQFQNEDGSLMDISNISISVELRYHNKKITSFRNKAVQTLIQRIDDSNFNVFIPRSTTEILPSSTDYELLVQLDDHSPHKTTWDRYPFKLS